MRYIMCTPSGCTYGCPLGHPLEPGARRADERQKEKESRPIMGTPLGCPYACPTGACINGPTLRGAHCRSPKGSSKKKKVMWDGGIHVNQPSKITKQINRENMCASNLGQILCEIGVNLRLDVCLPPPQPLLQRWNRPIKILRNLQKMSKLLGN